MSDCSIHEVKDFYKNTFYREAPIPIALQLGSPASKYSFHNNEVTKRFIEKEMSMYFNSGISIVIRQVHLPFFKFEIHGPTLKDLYQKSLFFVINFTKF
jgi:hypothetical protein